MIGSFEISDLVSSYYESTNLRKNDVILDNDYFKQIRSIIRAETQKIVFDSCEKVESIVISSLKLEDKCSVETDSILVKSLLTEIEKHPKLKSQLIFKISQPRYNISLFEEQALVSEKALSALLNK